MKRILCWFRLGGHYWLRDGDWHVRCKRCGTRDWSCVP